MTRRSFGDYPTYFFYFTDEEVAKGLTKVIQNRLLSTIFYGCDDGVK